MNSTGSCHGDQSVDPRVESSRALNALDESGRKVVSSRGTTEQRPNDRAAMAIFPADVRVGDDSELEIIGIPPGEIKRRHKRVGNVARRTELLADDDVIRIARPGQRFAPGEPVARLGEDRLAKIRTGANGTQDSRQCLSGFEYFRRAMRERNVFANGPAGTLRVASEKCAQNAHMSQSADANVAAPALSGAGTASIVGKELAVAFLNVGIPVTARGKHEFDVTSEVVVCVIALSRDERLHKNFSELKIQGVFARAQKLVIVNTGPPPVMRLLMKDFTASIEGRVFGARENAVGMRVSRCNVVADNAIVPAQGGSIVVPVDRHRQRVTNERAPSDAGAPLREDHVRRGSAFNGGRGGGRLWEFLDHAWKIDAASIASQPGWRKFLALATLAWKGLFV
jgi:hypothetical protein